MSKSSRRKNKPRRPRKPVDKSLRAAPTRGSGKKVAPCAVLRECGACATQQTPYEKQLENKRDTLVEALAGLCEPALIEPVQGLKQPFGYRTRLLMNAAPLPGRSKGFRLGFFKRGTTDLIDTTGCPVQHPLTLAATATVQQALRGARIEATAPKSDNGWLHGLGVRVDPATGSTEVTLVGRTARVPGGAALVDQIAAQPTVTSVHVAVNPERSSYLYGDRFEYLAGHRRTIFTLGGQQFHLSPGSFFQTNAEGAELLAATVLSMLPERFEALADIYGGVGVFARLTEGRWKRAIVAESNPFAIEDLQSHLRHVPTRALRVLKGKAEQTIHAVLDHNPDVAILDPPRSGCHPKALGTLADARPPIILYVACGLDSLIRDARKLLGRGYQIERVAAVDMFPHTHHIETIVRFVAGPEPIIEEGSL